MADNGKHRANFAERLTGARSATTPRVPQNRIQHTSTMAFLNDNYLKLKAGYLFPEIARRVKAFTDANADAAKRLIRCGIGDVTEPLPAAVLAALHKAVDEMGVRETFKGYGPEQGYEWLRKAIAENDFRAHGIEVADDEIVVSDGAKCDMGNILDILGAKNVIAVTDPVYPVYVDTNVMAGNTGDANERGAYAGLVYLEGNEANGFTPAPPAPGSTACRAAPATTIAAGASIRGRRSSRPDARGRNGYRGSSQPARVTRPPSGAGRS